LGSGLSGQGPAFQSLIPNPCSLFYRDALREVPRLIDVAAATDRDVVGEQLERQRH